jgi:flagellar basal body rod protein FlgB
VRPGGNAVNHEHEMLRLAGNQMDCEAGRMPIISENIADVDSTAL